MLSRKRGQLYTQSRKQKQHKNKKSTKLYVAHKNTEIVASNWARRHVKLAEIQQRCADNAAPTKVASKSHPSYAKS